MDARKYMTMSNKCLGCGCFSGCCICSCFSIVCEKWLVTVIESPATLLWAIRRHLVTLLNCFFYAVVGG